MANAGEVITLDGPPGVDSFVFRKMTGREELGVPFRYDLELSSRDFDLAPADVLGEPMSLHLELGNGAVRHFHGYVSEFSMPGTARDHALYHVTLRPWLWLLARSASCRIFQNANVPSIVKEVFREHGFTEFEERLTGQYRTRELTAQYRESDLDFVTRLLEEEGIAFSCVHQAATHVVVLTDSVTSFDPVPGYERVPYFPPDAQRARALEHLDSWKTAQHIAPGAYVHTDYDFLRPTASLLTKATGKHLHAMDHFEVYDYPGKYVTTEEGDAYARVRLEEQHALLEVAHAEGNVRGLSVGSLFSLREHPGERHNREYLVVAAEYTLRAPELRSGDTDEQPPFRVKLVATDSKRPFRPQRRTRRAVVQGVQTATVVGPPGEEIWTDEQGRVKLKFHWDRAEGAHEGSSCWVRVAQAWAGDGFGAVHIPRIGQEVVVDFLEGDPDRPLVTGRVYNGRNPPPYALPANRSQSGIKSRSSKGASASRFNELRFEDLAGKEEIHVQAERDLTLLIKNDEHRNVGHDQTLSVGHDRTKTVQGDETASVGGSRSASVAKSESISVGGSRNQTIGTIESVNIGAARTTTIGAADSLSVGAVQAINVGGSRSVTVAGSEVVAVGGSRSANVAKNDSASIAGNRSAQVGKNDELLVEGRRVQNVGKSDLLHVKDTLEIVSDKDIVLKSGDATLTLKKNGDISIKGKNLSFDGSGKVRIKASSQLVLKGSKISEN